MFCMDYWRCCEGSAVAILRVWLKMVGHPRLRWRRVVHFFFAVLKWRRRSCPSSLNSSSAPSVHTCIRTTCFVFRWCHINVESVLFVRLILPRGINSLQSRRKKNVTDGPCELQTQIYISEFECDQKMCGANSGSVRFPVWAMRETDWVLSTKVGLAQYHITLTRATLSRLSSSLGWFLQLGLKRLCSPKVQILDCLRASTKFS